MLQLTVTAIKNIGSIGESYLKETYRPEQTHAQLYITVFRKQVNTAYLTLLQTNGA